MSTKDKKTNSNIGTGWQAAGETPDEIPLLNCDPAATEIAWRRTMDFLAKHPR